MEFNIELLYENYSDKVYNYIILLVRNKELAEDLTHDTFLKAFRQQSSFRAESSPYTWLIIIARNLVYDHWRRKKLIAFIPFLKVLVPTSTASVEDIVIGDEETKKLYKSMLKIKSVYQEVLILRYIKEFSIRETALILNWTEPKVKLYTHRGMEQLKKIVLENGGGEHFNDSIR